MGHSPSVDLPAAMAHLDVAVFAHHPRTGEILAANEAVESVYDRDPSALVGTCAGDRGASESVYSESRATERIRTAAAGDPQEFQWLNSDDDGRRYWVNVHLERATVDDETVVLATVRDVSEYKRREQRTKVLYRVLRHNLRNDMNVISGNAEAVRGSLRASDVDVPGDVLERLATIEATGSDVADLSTDVEHLERASHPTSRAPSERGLEGMLEDVAAGVGQSLDCESIDVSVPTDCRVRVDDVFVRGLEHLVDNAVEHGLSSATAAEADDRSGLTGDGGVSRVTVRGSPVADDAIGQAESERSVRIEVVDGGPGIPSVEKDVLRADSGQTPLKHGSGLGLWVAKWAVEAHDGRLRFVDGDDATTVRIDAPIAVSE